jgi:hypothetical protein
MRKIRLRFRLARAVSSTRYVIFGAYLVKHLACRPGPAIGNVLKSLPDALGAPKRSRRWGQWKLTSIQAMGRERRLQAEGSDVTSRSTRTRSAALGTGWPNANSRRRAQSADGRRQRRAGRPRRRMRSGGRAHHLAMHSGMSKVDLALLGTWAGGMFLGQLLLTGLLEFAGAPHRHGLHGHRLAVGSAGAAVAVVASGSRRVLTQASRR